MTVIEEHMRQSADVTTDNQASPDDVAAALARDGHYYTAPPQDDFIRKCRGVLLALVWCAVFWVLVFLLIGGV